MVRLRAPSASSCLFRCASMIALLTAACGDDSADDDSATDTSEASTAAGGTATTSAATTSGSGSTSSGSTSVTTSGSGESDSGATDGTTTGEPDGELEPLFGVPNHDDDDGNGNRDWFDYPFAGDNDLNVFVLPEWYLSAVGPDHTVELSLSGDLNQLRFWLDGQLALGDDGEGGQPSYTLSAADAASAFDVEFADFLTRATLTVRRLGPGGVEERVDEVLLLAAPMLLNHHSQTAERVWAVQANNNGAMLAAFQQALGDKFTVINVNDVWVQDELEWATAAAPGQRLSVAVDSIRNRPLDAFVKGLRAPDVEPMTWGVSGTKTSHDSFGNLEATPPPHRERRRLPLRSGLLRPRPVLRPHLRAHRSPRRPARPGPDRHRHLLALRRPRRRVHRLHRRRGRAQGFSPARRRRRRRLQDHRRAPPKRPAPALQQPPRLRQRRRHRRRRRPARLQQGRAERRDRARGRALQGPARSHRR